MRKPLSYSNTFILGGANIQITASIMTKNENNSQRIGDKVMSNYLHFLYFLVFYIEYVFILKWDYYLEKIKTIQLRKK